MRLPTAAQARASGTAALTGAVRRLRLTVAWVRAEHGTSGLAVRAVALLALAGLLVSSLVVGLGTLGSDEQPSGEAEPGEASPGPPAVPASAQTVIDMAGRMRSLDGEQRAALVRERVIPHRSTRFLRGLDEAAEANEERWRSLEATPVAYRVLHDDGSDAYVSVLSRVERAAAAPGAGTTTSWDLTRFGVVSKWDRWWVYVYGGSTSDVEPGDAALDGFTRLR